MSAEKPISETYLGYILGAPRRSRTLEELMDGKSVDVPTTTLQERIKRFSRFRDVYQDDLNEFGIALLDRAIVSTITDLKTRGVDNIPSLKRFKPLEKK